MKILVAAIALGCLSASPALARDTQCQTDMIRRDGQVIDSFFGQADEFNQACRESFGFCQQELRYRQSQGRNRDARCVVQNSNFPIPGPTPQPDRGFREIECGSDDFKYNTCNAGGRILNIRLLKQYSDSDCIQGSTFGVDGRFIWVNNGCRARFGVRVAGFNN